ncbi:hypothetical protein [Mucilaginibacter pedocola]|uniref:hypothetical protein n=1 Tax=Mucilaginibacter pedocola TaxID=1792845 RepID=UPI00118007F7|nr:hypothetical protein [Mucilaginibacter pedocola]
MKPLKNEQEKNGKVFFWPGGLSTAKNKIVSQILAANLSGRYLFRFTMYLDGITKKLFRTTVLFRALRWFRDLEISARFVYLHVKTYGLIVNYPMYLE